MADEAFEGLFDGAYGRFCVVDRAHAHGAISLVGLEVGASDERCAVESGCITEKFKGKACVNGIADRRGEVACAGKLGSYFFVVNDPHFDVGASRVEQCARSHEERGAAISVDNDCIGSFITEDCGVLT